MSLVQRNTVVSPEIVKMGSLLLFNRIKSSLQICLNPTACFKIRLIKFKFCGYSMISQPLSNAKIKTQFIKKEEVTNYDNIALNQGCITI